MIPYAACVCFGGPDTPKRPWKILTAQEGTSLIIGKDDSLHKNHRGEEDESFSSELSTSEVCMLEAVRKTVHFPVPFAEQEVKIIGRRSRQPVITRILDLSLLDDTYAGITQTLLSNCNSWAFNTFNLDVSTGGRSLSYLLVHLFQEYGFVKYFRLDIVKVWHCFNLMEAAYHRHNPYHNSVHAADVTQAMHCFLQENKFSANLTPLEAMSSVIAAVAHDLDHPGVTQAFLVATSNHLVNLYHNASVLENHHWRTAISCLSESGIFNHLEREIWYDIQKHIRSLILATDITRQKEFLAKFKNYLSSESLDMEDSKYRHFALQIALKCADLCNPCRPWAISQRWSYQVCQEFYRQGAYERQLNLPLTPTFDCSRTKMAKIQADFFQFVVSPLFETWDHFLKTPLSNQLLENLQHNFTQWQQRITVQTSDVEIEIPQIKIDLPSCEGGGVCEDESTEKDQLLTVDSDIIIKQHRSKSDSGLTAGLISPKIHMETYSTEELHPSTTLLSLSSITNTVQLRQVYAATKVESHLICPTVFQPLCSNVSTKGADSSEIQTSSQICDAEMCSKSENENSDNDEEDTAQSVAKPPCTNGCCTPPATPEKSSSLHIHKSKQRSQSLIHDSEETKCCSQVLKNRRASDFDFYRSKNSFTSEMLTPSIQDTESMRHVEQSSNEQLCFNTNTSDSFNKPLSIKRKNKKYSLDPSNMCSNKQCSRTICICKTESDKKIPSWCWHITRSFSAERPVRPTQDFDSPLPSTHGSSSSLNYAGYNRRRGSAPVTYSINAEVGISNCSNTRDIESTDDIGKDSETNYTSGRRWSIPMEISDIPARNPPPTLPENKKPPMLNIRRSSFGLLEPLLTLSAVDTDNAFGQSCSPIIKSFQPNLQPLSSFDQRDQSSRTEDKCITSSESLLPSFTSSQASVQRRGSLPTDLYTSEEKEPPLKETSDSSNTATLIFEQARKHGSPSDLLSILIGPSGMLNTMHGIVSGQTISERSSTLAQDISRRRSGGLEMLSGLWKSRTNDNSINIGMARKINLRRELLDAWTSWRMEETAADISASTTSTLPISPQFVYQPRRGSVPLNVSLLSVSSENTLSGEKVS